MRAIAIALLIPCATLPAAAQPSAWYDPSDLMRSLRARERSSVLAEAQIRHANELPLYELSIDVAGDLSTFELEETLWFTNRTGRALSTLVLRVFANASGREGEPPLVDFVRGECLGGASCSFRQIEPSAIVVTPASAIAPGGRARVLLRLRGRLREIPAERTTMLGQGLEALGGLGAGHSSGDYGLLARSGGLASLSHFFPVLARMRGGVWEERDASTMGDLGTDELAHVRARIRVPSGVAVAASGIATTASHGAHTEHVALAGFVRDFALVMGAALSSRERNVGGVTVRSWFVDGDAAAGTQVLDAAAHALAIFARRFGPYPYPELDVAEAPLVGGAGGVEYSGLVTVASMFYRPLSAPSQGPLAGLIAGADLEARRRSSLEFVTAHEVAHQYWHGLVGSDSRRHPFQDECLAQYSAMLYVAERYGPERARREADQQVAASYHMMRLLGRADAAVDRPASAFADSLAYAGIVYGKGPFLYPALRATLGDRAFFRALSEYVREHRFRIAPPRALFDRMARGPRADAVRALERRWLDEAHGDADLGPPDLGRVLGGDAAAGDPSDILRQLER